MKIFGHIIFIIGFLLITFFGIGPVLFADGTMNERIITLVVVLLIYGIWFFLYRTFMKKMRNKY